MRKNTAAPTSRHLLLLAFAAVARYAVSAQSNSSTTTANVTLTNVASANVTLANVTLASKSGYGPLENSDLPEPTTGVGWGGFYGYPSRFAGYPIVGYFPALKPGFGHLDFQYYALGYYSPYYTEIVANNHIYPQPQPSPNTGYVNQGYGSTAGYKPFTGYGGYGGGGYGGGYDGRSALAGRSGVAPAAAKFNSGYDYTEKLSLVGQSSEPESVLPREPRKLRHRGALVPVDETPPTQSIRGTSYGVSYGQEELPPVDPVAAGSILTRKRGAYGGYSGYGDAAGVGADNVATSAYDSSGGRIGVNNAYVAYPGLSPTGYAGYAGQYGGISGLGVYGGYPVAAGAYSGPGGWVGSAGLVGRQGGAYGGYSGYGGGGAAGGGAVPYGGGGAIGGGSVDGGGGQPASYGAYGGSGWGGYGGGGYGGYETGNPGYSTRYPGYKTSFAWGFGGPTKAYTTY